MPPGAPWSILIVSDETLTALSVLVKECKSWAAVCHTLPQYDTYTEPFTRGR